MNMDVCSVSLKKCPIKFIKHLFASILMTTKPLRNAIKYGEAKCVETQNVWRRKMLRLYRGNGGTAIMDLTANHDLRDFLFYS